MRAKGEGEGLASLTKRTADFMYLGVRVWVRVKGGGESEGWG